MRVAAISDLHIGTTAERDGFRHGIAAFLRRLDALEAAHDRIVLLGDVFQTDHTAWPSRSARARHFHAARDRVAALWDRFARPPYVYVHGNHDEIARDVVGAPEHHRVPGACPALFIHGHQFDPVAVRAKTMADLGTWTCGRLRAYGLRTIATWLEARDVTIKDRRFRGHSGPYATAARGLARDHGVPIVVMGHTHVPSIVPIPEGLAVNTGTCSGGQWMVASIDTDTGRVQVQGPDGARVAVVDHSSISKR